MKPQMNQTIIKRAVTTNAFGSIVASSEDDETLVGKFRYITEVIDTHQQREQEDSDGIAWFTPDSGIVKGDVIYVESDSEHFRITKVIKARTLGSNNIEFLKCFVRRFALIS